MIVESELEQRLLQVAMQSSKPGSSILLVVSIMFLGKISNLIHIFQMGWFNHQPDKHGNPASPDWGLCSSRSQTSFAVVVAMGFFDGDIWYASEEFRRTVDHLHTATQLEVDSLFRKADKLAKRASVEAGLKIEATHQSVQQILRFDVPYAARAAAENFVDGLASKLFGTVPRQGLLRKEVLKMLKAPHANLRAVLDLLGNQEVTKANELWECYQIVFLVTPKYEKKKHKGKKQVLPNCAFFTRIFFQIQ